MGFHLFKSGKNGFSQKHRGQEHVEDIIPIDRNFDRVMKKVEEIYTYPTNQDFMERKFTIPFFKKAAVLFYIDPMVDGEKIERSILNALIHQEEANTDSLKDYIESNITINSMKEISTMNEVTHEINYGKTVLFVDGINIAYSLDTTSFAHRGVQLAQTESVIKGPKEAFVESAKVNLSLIRKQLKDEHLVSESVTVGKRVKNSVNMLYIKDIANDSLVESVRKRLTQIDTDIIQNLEILEEYVEERSFSLVPTVLFTERPDRAVSFLAEGHVILLMDDSSTCMVVPVTYWALLHSPEDSYLRLIYGNFVRMIRFLSTFIALITPASYLAITQYHTEMLPTDLLLAIAATREKVPFPEIIELLLMELAFEVLREAGIRIPNQIGPTIGIVGALILGQAAVDANIVSPIMVIVVSITGLSSFAIPDISLSYMIRLMRFIFTIAAAFMGIFGIIVVMAMVFAYMSSVTSFGVPFFSPVAPYYKSSNDTLFRLPVWMEYLRPGFLYPKDMRRRKETKKGFKP